MKDEIYWKGWIRMDKELMKDENDGLRMNKEWMKDERCWKGCKKNEWRMKYVKKDV